MYPLTAVAESIKKMWIGVETPLEMFYLGPQDVYTNVFANRGIEVRTIVSAKLRRYFSLENILDIPKFFIGLAQALVKLYVIMPDVIFSKGGTGALPVVLAAWWYRIPIAIHESDTIPGLTNLFSARFAKRVCVSFPEAAEHFPESKVVLTGTPVRRALLEGRTTLELAKDALGFSSSKPLIFVIGGSQGSQRINAFVLENLRDILFFAEIFHQTGAANFSEVDKLAQAALLGIPPGNRYKAVGFLDEPTMKTALTAADVVLTRGGANSLLEIASFGKPAIIVPHQGGSNGHQRANAYAFEKGGAAIIIEENNLLPNIVLAEMKKLVNDPKLREKMGAAALAKFVPDAADRIATEVLKIAA